MVIQSTKTLNTVNIGGNKLDNILDFKCLCRALQVSVMKSPGCCYCMVVLYLAHLFDAQMVVVVGYCYIGER